MSAYTALVVLAALLWGLTGGVGGLLIARGWDPFVISWYRGAIGLLFVIVWLTIRPGHSGLASRQLWFWSVIAGLGVAGNFAFYFLSIDKSSVAVAATLMYCAPVLVYLASFALNIERSSAPKWAAIILVIIGVALLTQFYDIGAVSITPVGMGAGLLAGVSYAIFIFGFRYAVPHGSPQAILVIVFGVLVITLFWPSDAEQILAALTTPDWPLFAAIGVLGAGLSFVLYIIGLKHTPPAVASIVAMVEPVTASLFGVMVLSERLSALQIAGMGLIIVTVTALSAYSSYGQFLRFKKRADYGSE